MLNGLLFTLFSTGVMCVVAVGFASLTGSRPAALTVLIGWQLIASRILENIESLGSSRELILSQAVAHFSPISLDDGHGPQGRSDRDDVDGHGRDRDRRLDRDLRRARRVAHAHDGRLTRSLGHLSG